MLAFLIGNFLFAGLLVTPVVVVSVARRAGFRRSLILAAGLGVFVGLLAAIVPDASWTTVAGAGLAIGVGIAGLGIVLWHYGSKSIAVDRLFIGAAAFAFLGTVGQYLALQVLSGHSLVDVGFTWLIQLRLSFDQYIVMLSSQISGEQLADLNALKAQKHLLVWTIFRVLPSMATFAIVGLVLVNVLLARRILPALRDAEFNRWRVPDIAVWAVLLPALGLLPYLILPMVGRDTDAVAPLFYVCLNLVLISLVPYVLQGLGVMSFFMKRWRFPRLLRGLTYFMVLTQGLPAVVPVLGLMEFWTDWRGRSVARDAAQRDQDEKENNGT